jgi:hypothetical protein
MIDAVIPEFLTQLAPNERTPCHEQPDLFVPDWSLEPTENFHHPAPRTEKIQHAKLLCAACPLTDACLEHAIRTRQPDGIWGGLTPTERKKTTTPPAECGTEQAWRSHLSRREGCTTCREAHQQRQRTARQARLDTEHQHGGSLTGYRLELLLGLPTCNACRAARQTYYANRPRTSKWYRRATTAA